MKAFLKFTAWAIGLLFVAAAIESAGTSDRMVWMILMGIGIACWLIISTVLEVEKKIVARLEHLADMVHRQEASGLTISALHDIEAMAYDYRKSKREREGLADDA